MRLRVNSTIIGLTMGRYVFLLSAISAAGSCNLKRGGIPVIAAQIHSACLRIHRECANFPHHTHTHTHTRAILYTQSQWKSQKHTCTLTPAHAGAFTHYSKSPRAAAGPMRAAVFVKHRVTPLPNSSPAQLTLPIHPHTHTHTHTH